MKYEIKTIPLGSVLLSVYPLILFIIGAVSGIVTEIMVRSNSDMGTILWRIGVYTFTYLVSMLAVSVVIVVAYNFFCSVVGMRGISVRFDAVPENDSEKAEIESL